MKGFDWLNFADSLFFKAEPEPNAVTKKLEPFPDLSDLEKEAIVTQPIRPGNPGQVYFQGSWWTARCDQAIMLRRNERVYVVGRINLTVFVESRRFQASEPVTLASQVA